MQTQAKAAPAADAAPAITLRTLTVPPLGAYWPEQGGVFSGLIRGKDGAPDYLLITGPQHTADVTWAAAKAWAAELLGSDGHEDFTLPTLSEQAVQFGNVPELFEPRAYWSCQPYEDDSGGAWCQNFGDGYQDFSPTNGKLRARAVRRVVI